jgi:hypothetical protein
MTTLITYKIVSDKDGLLKAAGKIACNFWNKYLSVNKSIVMRLGVFTAFGNTVAQSYKPFEKGGLVYGNIEFNSNYLETFTDVEIVGTIMHELGHTIGFGWDKWMKLFNADDGRFKKQFVDKVPDLGKMLVERDFGPGTTLVHWDEKKFGGELMTGIKNKVEHILPVTIDVTALFGHKVIERLAQKTPLKGLITTLEKITFDKKDLAGSLDRDHFVKTDIWEETYSDRRTKTPHAVVRS